MQEAGPHPEVSAPGIDPRIWDIHQCRNGDYWFGSNGNGAYRYDGDGVTHFTPRDGLAGLHVRDIQEDARGHVLISTNQGVSVYDGERFSTLELVEEEAGAGWTLDPEDVWIVFEPGGRGPCRYDGEKLYSLKLTGSPAEEVTSPGSPQPSRLSSGVYSIHKDRRGHLWFGTAEAGACRFDGENLSWMYEERLTTTPSGGAFGIRSIFEDRTGHFWICNTRQRFKVSSETTLESGHRLIQYESKAGVPASQSDTDENFTYYPSMTEDSQGVLWMACGSDGVWKYDGESVTRFPIGDDAYAITIHLDLGGKLWVGTLESGIHTLEGATFEPFRPPVDPGR